MVMFEIGVWLVVIVLGVPATIWVVWFLSQRI